MMTKKKEAAIQEAGFAFHRKLTDTLKSALDGRARKNSFTHMSVGNLADLIRYSTLVIDRQYRKAQIMQHNFDTSVYESIPNFLWEKIEYLD